MRTNKDILDQMQKMVITLKQAGDDKALFLACYRMMTGNVLGAIDRHRFNDPVWVDLLLHHFADYYFDALEAYHQIPASAPGVWQLAHKAAADPDVSALQKLLLGVNAHINYDLVLTLVDLLEAEWGMHSQIFRDQRYQDHCLINEIIAETIDAVQDDVLEPAMPVLNLVDKLFGPVDELLISRLISDWREGVWLNAAGLLEMADEEARQERIRQVELDTRQISKWLLGISSG